MDVKIIFYIILALILLLSVTFAVIWIIRKRNSRRKVCEMQMSQKVRLLNGLTEPSGFMTRTGTSLHRVRTHGRESLDMKCYLTGSRQG